MDFDKNKFELVYCTTDFKDSAFEIISNICKINNWRFVLIIPTTKKYSTEINKVFSILGNDFLIYEMSMGMGIVLKSRAEKYVKYIENSELYDEDKVYIT